MLAIELNAPLDAPETWLYVDQSSPFRYRILFRFVLRLVWELSNQLGTELSFSAIFIGCSFFCGLLLLVELGHSETIALAGCLACFLCAPFLLAYRFSVHTKEDLLFLSLINLSFLAYFRRKPMLTSAGFCLATMCRETGLIAAAAFLFFSKRQFVQRLGIVLPSIVFSIIVRLTLGFQPYDPFSGAARNFDHPFESAAFFFLTFGALWLPALSYWHSKYFSQRCGDPADSKTEFLVRSFPIMFVLNSRSILFFARIREIRFEFVLVPWILAFSVGWWQKNKARLTSMILSRGMRVYLKLLVLVCLYPFFAFWRMDHAYPEVDSAWGSLLSQEWRVGLMLQVLLTCALLPLVFLNRSGECDSAKSITGRRY